MNGEHDVDWPVIYRALADDERRSLMQYLVRTSGRSSVAEIVAELGGHNGPALDEPTEAGAMSGLHVRLLHTHLPKLADADLLWWDRGSGEVTATALAASIPAVFITPRVLPRVDQASPEEASD